MLFRKIKRLCGEKGITISALEKRLGFGNATIRGWETSSPTVEKLKLVADFFGVKIDELLSPDPAADDASTTND